MASQTTCICCVEMPRPFRNERAALAPSTSKRFSAVYRSVKPRSCRIVATANNSASGARSALSESNTLNSQERITWLKRNGSDALRDKSIASRTRTVSGTLIPAKTIPTSFVAVSFVAAINLFAPPLSSCTDLLSVPDCESLARVLRLFQLVHECDRKVLRGYAALTVSTNQEFIFTKSELAGAFAGSKEVRRRQEGPIEFLLLTQDIQEFHTRERLRLVFGGKVRGVHQSKPGCDLQTSCSSDNKQSWHFRGLGCGDDFRGIGTEELHAVDRDIVPSKHSSKCGLVLHVRCGGIHTVLSIEFFRVSSDSSDLMSTAAQF